MAGGKRTEPGDFELRVGRILNQWAGAQRVSRIELGAAIGVSASQVSRMLTGKTGITLTELRGLSSALGLDHVSVLRVALADGGFERVSFAGSE